MPLNDFHPSASLLASENRSAAKPARYDLSSVDDDHAASQNTTDGGAY